MHSDLVISQADRRPMYLQIMEQIRRRIAVGDWPPGHEIPSIRALAAAVQVSVITVKRAYLELEREGAILTRQGKGSFVADNAGLSAQLRRGELDVHLSAAVDLGHQLGLTPQEVEQRLRDLQAERTEPDALGRISAGDATGKSEPATGRFEPAAGGPEPATGRFEKDEQER